MTHADYCKTDVDRSGLRPVLIAGTTFHAITETECVQHVQDRLRTGLGGWIVTLNVENLRRARLSPAVRSLVATADLILADGMPLVWAGFLQGTPFPERVTGSNLIWSLTAACAQSGRSVFLLGGSPGSADAAKAVLQHRHPDLRITGTYCPPLGFETKPAEWERIAAALREEPADLIFVALGFPKQEQVIDRFRSDFPGFWWIGVGISFSFVAGSVHRAPRWMQCAGLEWFHRFLQEPRRLFKRYFLHDIPFALKILALAAWERISRRSVPPGTT